MIDQAAATWVLSEFRKRLGLPYAYGEHFVPDDPSQSTDCSGLVGWALEGLVHGPQNMSWEHTVSTESWPYDYSTDTPAHVGSVGPYGTVAVADLGDVPASAALVINIMHGGGGEDSHMNCVLAGTIMESNGDHGVCTNGTGAYPSDAPLFTDHWYLPGPIATADLSALVVGQFL